jgi:hypothetical protein
LSSMSARAKDFTFEPQSGLYPSVKPAVQFSEHVELNTFDLTTVQAHITKAMTCKR